MARIQGATNEKVFTFQKWLGLNEHPDGDTRLKLGEASVMSNWKITRDGNLKRRPGSEVLSGLCTTYTVDISPDVEVVRTGQTTDIITLYPGANAMTHPGVITLEDNMGSVIRGKWKYNDITVDDGVLIPDEDSELTVISGVLGMPEEQRAFDVTIEQLATTLAALDEGEYLYYQGDEAVYALDKNALEVTGNRYTINGYLTTAKVSGTPKPVTGMWSGLAGGKQCFLAACDGKIWSLYDEDTDTFEREALGSVATDKGVSFVPFDGKVYILNGYEYYVYDGTTIDTVVGYIPLVAIAIGPLDTDTDNDSTPDTASNAGELTGEYVNRLTPKRRVWISPDGTNKTFQLPEKGLKSIDSVTDLTTGQAVATGWSGNAANGTVTFSTAPAKAVNSYEIGYTAKKHSDDATIPDYRAQVTGNLFAELYAGNQDTAIFIYGDGTNRTLYTGMDYNGQPRADYFPDQYEVHVGDSNTPITSMIRHYSDLVCYKTDSCWALNYSLLTLPDESVTSAVYVTTVNRDKGNVAPGQVRLVDNNPVTCSGTELYHWINSSYYTSHLSRDERQARRISDRVQRSIKELDFRKCCMWDDNDNQEFYITGEGIAIVWNYAADAWYRYDSFDATRMCSFQGDVYYGTSDGFVVRLTYDRQTDNGKVIQAVWESGAMDFGADYMRKYAAMIWVGLKPEAGTSVDVCVETDRKNTFRDKVVSSEKAKVPGQPFVVKTKIKAKKFEFYRLLLSVGEKQPAVTVTNIDIRVRQTGYAK